MLQFFRSFFKSKLGIPVTLAFLVVIAIAFTSGDLVGSNTFGGIAGGDRVAVVGSHRIDTSDLSQAMNSALDAERQRNPTQTMEAFIAGGGLESVLNQMLQRTALAEFAHDNGLRAGKRLVDSELVQIQAFQGIDGKFDRNAFLAALRQRGLSEEMVRTDVAAGLYARQMLLPASYAAAVPKSMAQRYAQLLKERRKGAIATLPSAAFAPKGDPATAQLNAYYTAHRTDYLRPERRVIRYITFGQEALGAVTPPSEAQIAARYQRDAAQYQAKQTRTFTQLVLPTEAAAKAVAAEVSGGTSLAAAASSKGLATTKVGPITQADFATQASQAVANAAFAANEGALVAPTRGALGWYLVRVEAVENTPARSLAQVHDEIAKAIAEEQRKAAFADLAASVEDRLDGGESLADIAKSLKAEIQTTPPITADGRVYGKNETAPAVLTPALRTAFEMQEGEPQLADADPGKTYLVFEASSITPSAAAPLAEIRDEVIADWRRSEGAKAAKAAAQRIMDRISKGQDLAAALAAEKVTLPPPDHIDLGRDELAQRGPVPPVMALMFSMAKGTVKRLEGPANNGWFVVKLDDVTLPPIDQNDPLVAATQQRLSQIFGDEYSQELVAAAQRSVGVTKNQAAIDAVAKQLTGRTE
jgi:peptidyl-prolyl cis-trans isomerase D